MNTNEYSSIIILVMFGYFSLIFLTSITRPVVFAFEPVFRMINHFQWFIRNPVRLFWKNKHKNHSRNAFLFLSMTGITLLWWIIGYIVALPFRFINGLYYDVVLYIAVSLADNIDEFLQPKRGKLGHTKGFKFVILYLLTLPFRFIKMIFNSALYILDSFLMLGVSILFPTLTMLHGTNFRSAGTKITQSGDWYVGEGNYAGTGIYFGMTERTANHYAPSDSDNSIIIARVTLTFCKTIATLSGDDRELVTLGDKGEKLAQKVKGFYASTEHWRTGLNWWEYCLLKPGKMRQMISTWRIRPVALLHNSKIVRTYGGFSHYSMGSGFFMGILSWFVIVYIWILFSAFRIV